MSSKQPEIVVFAGPNGSGKSTFTEPPWIKGVYVNADDIVRERGITNLDAAIYADELREMLIAQGATFTFETVLSRPNKLDLLQRARDKGYFIRGYFILTCDPNLNVARVQSRVYNGGHDVPKEAIIRRYKRSFSSHAAYSSYVHHSTLGVGKRCVNSSSVKGSKVFPPSKL